ncbi:hypothetical protein BLOT_004291 [Blomia tropicalis]|nr:hypothetical protein BLOT_004291 [Blomia tropicalis]
MQFKNTEKQKIFFSISRFKQKSETKEYYTNNNKNNYYEKTTTDCNEIDKNMTWIFFTSFTYQNSNKQIQAGFNDSKVIRY